MNYFRTIFVVAIACSLTIPQASLAKFPQTPQTKNDARMVLLHVRVTDSTGKAIVDVPQSSILITEDGVPQKIELLVKEDSPLIYGLMIDSSGSVRGQYPHIMRAAEQIIGSNRSTDETFLVRFISSDKIYTAQEPTSDKALLKKVLDDFFYLEGGYSAVIDAVYLSAEKLAQQKMDPANFRRRVLVLITDGEDRESYYKPEHLFKLLAATDVQIFAIGLTSDLKPQSRDRAINLLNRLGAATGGQTFFAATAADIERISKEIMHEIRTQYVIGYVPSGIDTNKHFHKIHISLNDNPNQEKRANITRVGYSTQD